MVFVAEYIKDYALLFGLVDEDPPVNIIGGCDDLPLGTEEGQGDVLDIGLSGRIGEIDRSWLVCIIDSAKSDKGIIEQWQNSSGITNSQSFINFLK